MGVKITAKLLILPICWCQTIILSSQIVANNMLLTKTSFMYIALTKAYDGNEVEQESLSAAVTS
jgi:hypothetical protein